MGPKLHFQYVPLSGVRSLAEEYLLRSITLAPFRPDPSATLSLLYTKIGNRKKADLYLKLAQEVADSLRRHSKIQPLIED
jgi:hypothetical protein